MSTLEINKIIAAVLTAGIAASFSGFVADLLIHPKMPEENAYVLAGAAEEPAAADEVEEAPAQPFGVLLAAAEPSDGESVAKKCTSCHTFDEGGANRIGPNLWNVVNRPVAGVEDFSYSSALEDMADQQWTYENLSGFLANPREYAPGTKMTFAGISKDEDRADLIAYLRTLSDSPPPLPETE